MIKQLKQSRILQKSQIEDKKDEIDDRLKLKSEKILKVKFADDIQSTIQIIKKRQIPSSNDFMTNIVHILNLCDALTESDKMNKCIDFLADDESRYKVYCQDIFYDTSSFCFASSKISLQKTLENCRKNQKTIYMSRRSRLYLTLLLRRAFFSCMKQTDFSRFFEAFIFNFFASTTQI